MTSATGSSNDQVILVVEDEFIIRVLVVDALTDAGFLVIEAQQADEALVFLQSAAVTVNAVFTDVNMPGKMNGVELAHETRRCWPWIHLLVTSALLKPPTSDLPERCRFLPKPYKVERVIDHIREMIAAQM